MNTKQENTFFFWFFFFIIIGIIYKIGFAFILIIMSVLIPFTTITYVNGFTFCETNPIKVNIFTLFSSVILMINFHNNGLI